MSSSHPIPIRLAILAKAISGLAGLRAHPGLPTQFDGNYSDPNHPGCPRAVCWETRLVMGTDGDPGCEAPGANLTQWAVPIVDASTDGTITVDFSSKGGPKDLKGDFEGFKTVWGIRWEDGNFWQRHHTGCPANTNEATTEEEHMIEPEVTVRRVRTLRQDAHLPLNETNFFFYIRNNAQQGTQAMTLERAVGSPGFVDAPDPVPSPTFSPLLGARVSPVDGKLDVSVAYSWPLENSTASNATTASVHYEMVLYIGAGPGGVDELDVGAGAGPGGLFTLTLDELEVRDTDPEQGGAIEFGYMLTIDPAH